MRILLTGSDGFIGAALLRDLRQAGHQVVGTCYDRARGASHSDEIFLDLTDPNTFENLPTTPFDAVVHAAGIVDQRIRRKSMMAVNAKGTGRLVLWAKANGRPHFIYLSSISVYGWRTMGQNRTEERTGRSGGIPAVPYMGSKARAERAIEASGIPYTILRLPAVLGSRDSYLSPTIISALQSRTFFTCGSGEQKVSLMYVGNLAAVVHRIMLAGPADRAFNCCDAHVPWNTLVAEYAHCLGVDIPGRKRSGLSILTHLRDKRYLLLATFSRFGAHFPDALLHARVPHNHAHSWQEGVAEAVAGYNQAVAGYERPDSALASRRPNNRAVSRRPDNRAARRNQSNDINNS
ncbi:MAG: NAD(P)-dependent oxidoreductase [Spirochaetaceae bacterium]|nr:MAG: NAD(P)-dependent oxidoreductase [Spirochaetaceae bacterium]